MTIRVKLYITFILSIVIVSIICFFVFFISQGLKQEMEECSITEEILHGIFDLNILTSDYLLHQEERAQIQWQSRYDSLEVFFTPETIAVFDEDERDSIRNLHKHYGYIGEIFTKLTVEREQQSSNSEGENAVSKELEQRLVGQFSICSQAMVSIATKLGEDSHKELMEAQSRAIIFIFSSLGMLILLIIAALAWLIGSMVKPLGLLQKGAEAIGKGNLGYRLNIKTGDEIEYLANEFNKMAEKLRVSYGSLKRRVEERTQELEEAKNRSEVLLASIGDGVFAINKERNIIHFNRRAEELSGYKASEVLGKPYYDFLKFIKEKDRSENVGFVRKALKGKATDMADETLLIRKDGGELPVEDSAAPVKNGREEVIGVIVTFRDAIKERKIQQMRSEFITLTSHEMRVPLGIIKNYLTELTDKKIGPLTKEQEVFIEKAMKATDKLLKQSEELLEISRIEEGRMKIEPVLVDPLDLAKKTIGKEILQLFKQKKQEFIFKESKGLPKIKIDPQFIMVPIQNLLSNASKYTPEKGKIEFEISQKDSRITFKIADSGIGIPKEEQFKVFQRFFRASNAVHIEKGTGLGLYIAKLMIELSGGKIWLESEEGKGTAFYFHLPVFKQQIGPQTKNLK